MFDRMRFLVCIFYPTQEKKVASSHQNLRKLIGAHFASGSHSNPSKKRSTEPLNYLSAKARSGSSV